MYKHSRNVSKKFHSIPSRVKLLWFSVQFDRNLSWVALIFSSVCSDSQFKLDVQIHTQDKHTHRPGSRGGPTRGWPPKKFTLGMAIVELGDFSATALRKQSPENLQFKWEVMANFDCCTNTGGPSRFTKFFFRLVVSDHSTYAYCWVYSLIYFDRHFGLPSQNKCP